VFGQMRGGQNLFGVKACGGVGTCTTTGPSKCDCAVHTVARCAHAISSELLPTAVLATELQ
jgi:hypothetical protein